MFSSTRARRRYWTRWRRFARRCCITRRQDALKEAVFAEVVKGLYRGPIAGENHYEYDLMARFTPLLTRLAPDQLKSAPMPAGIGRRAICWPISGAPSASPCPLRHRRGRSTRVCRGRSPTLLAAGAGRARQRADQIFSPALPGAFSRPPPRPHTACRAGRDVGHPGARQSLPRARPRDRRHR